jgi:hypothetical protein
MDYRNFWMYSSLRFKAGFCDEVDKFIKAVEEHPTMLIENSDSDIIVPAKIARTLLHYIVDSSW